METKIRELWLYHGGTNSKFFHTLTIVQYRQNHISKIKLPNDIWIYDRDEIRKYFISNYQALFTSTNIHIGNELGELIQPKVIEEEQFTLTQIITSKEIFQTLKAMNPYKFLRSDGYPHIFYVKCWDIILIIIIEAIQTFFKSSFMLDELNHAFIVLIPKNLKACDFIEYKPISLCNLIYKLT